MIRSREAALWAVALAAVIPATACAPAAPGVRTDTGAGVGSTPSTPPTWSNGVATLVHERCTPCHRPEGSAPFPLLTYEDAAGRSARIAKAARARTMPPWLPDPDVGSFVGDRRLDPEAIGRLVAWAAAGAPEGDRAAVPPPPDLAAGWSLGPPDLVVTFPTDTISPEGRDVYRNLVASVPARTTRWIRAVDLDPGNRRVVHHARMMVDTTTSSRELAAQDARERLDVMHMSGQARDPDGFFLGWTPGRTPDPGRPGLAWRLAPGTDLVLQLHLRPTGTAEVIRPRVGLWFADAPPAREQALVVLRSVALDIAPGDTAFVAEESYRIPVAVDVLTIYPHAHYLGKRLEVRASPPSGRTRILLRISDWNFDWQDAYRPMRPVRLPAGSVLTMHYTYDNASSNPRNPFDPPRRIRYGLSSTDEMAELIVQVLAVDPHDDDALRTDLDRYAWQADRRHRAEILVTSARDAAEDGHLDASLGLYREALQIQDAPTTMAAMADVLLLRGDAASALTVAEQAATLTDRRDPRVLGVLGRAYAAAGRTDEARVTLREGVEAARTRRLPAVADSLSAQLRALGGPPAR